MMNICCTVMQYQQRQDSALSQSATSIQALKLQSEKLKIHNPSSSKECPSADFPAGEMSTPIPNYSHVPSCALSSKRDKPEDCEYLMIEAKSSMCSYSATTSTRFGTVSGYPTFRTGVTVSHCWKQVDFGQVEMIGMMF